MWGRVEVHTGIWWLNLRVRDHLEDVGLYRWVILKWICRMWVGKWARVLD